MTHLRRFRTLVPALLVTFALGAVAAPAALATWAGTNGPIAVVVSPPSDPAGLPESGLPGIRLVAPGTSSGPVPLKGFSPAWSADGLRVAYGCRTICIANADGTNIIHVAGTTRYDGAATFSPDGTKLVFARYVRTHHNSQIRVVDLTTGVSTRFTNPPASSRVIVSDSEPRYSTDGSTIVFTRYTQRFNASGDETTEHTDLYAVASGGSAPIALLVSTKDHNVVDPDFSPDGTKLAFAREGFRTSNLRPYQLDLVTGAVTAVAAPRTSSITGLSYSPDGTMLAMESIGPHAYAGKLCTVVLATGAISCPYSRLPLTSPAWRPLH